MKMQHRPMKVFKDGGKVSSSLEDRVSIFAQRDSLVRVPMVLRCSFSLTES